MKKYIAGIITAIFVLAAFLIYYCFFRPEMEKKAGIITLVFLIILAAVVLVVALTLLKKAAQITEDLKKAAHQLNAQKEEFRQAADQVEKRDKLLKKIEFSVDTMQESYERYCEELKRIQKETNAQITCDIEDYLSVSLINQQIHKGICEAIPGVATGLGILGTFVGLMFGLQGFSFGSGAGIDVMENSLQALINGIKTAFLTSVFGIVFSIVHNFIYRFHYHGAVDALDQFYAAFHSCAIYDADNEMNRAMLKAYETQNQTVRDAMQEMKTEFVSQMKEQSGILQTGMQEQASQFAAALKQFQSLSESVYTNQTEALQNGIDTQSQNLRAALKQFEQNASDVFTKQTAELSDQVSAMKQEFTEQASQQTESLQKGIEAQSQNISNALADFETKASETFTQQTDALSGQVSAMKQEFTEQARQQTEAMQKGFDAQSQVLIAAIEQFDKSSAESLEKQNQSWTDGMEAFKMSIANLEHAESAYYKKLEETVDQICEREDTLVQNTAQMQQFRKELEKFANGLVTHQQQLSESCREFAAQTAQLTDKTAETIDAGNDCANAAGDVRNAVAAFRESMEECVQNMTESVKSTGQDAISHSLKMLQSVGKIDSDAAERNEQLAEVLKTTHTQFQSLLEKHKDYLDVLQKDGEVIRAEIAQASKSMKQSGEQLDAAKTLYPLIQSCLTELEKSYQGVIEQAADIAKKAANGAEISQKTMDAAARMKDVLSAFTEETQEALAALRDENKRNTGEIVKAYRDTQSILETERKQVSGMMDSIAKQQADQLGNLTNLYANTSDAAAALREASHSISDASDRMHENYTGLSEEVEKHLTTSLKDYDAVTASVASRFLELLRQIEKQTAYMPEVQQRTQVSLEALYEKWNTLLERMARLTEQFAGADSGK